MLLALIPALAGSVELQLSAVAMRSSARHTLTPMFGARAELGPHDHPAFGTLEVGVGSRVVDGEVFVHRTLFSRTSLGIGLQRRTGRIGVHGWLGPAVVVRAVRVQEATSTLDVQGGVRAAAGVGWYFSRRLGARFQVGGLARMGRRVDVDYDANLGTVVHW